MSGLLDILIIDDEKTVHDTLGDYLTDLGHCVAHAADGRIGLISIREREFDIALIDIRMPQLDGMALMEEAQSYSPETSFIVITGYADMRTVIEALRLGAADFLVKPIKLDELDAVLAKAVRLRKLRRESRHLRDAIRGMQDARSRSEERRFVGNSPAARWVRSQIGEAARGQCETILVTGETGTGKEVVARALHMAAADEMNPFVPVNCPALPKDLVESELFGHTKGAFTGAIGDRAGAFELADGGTLFLDEIGDLAAPAQAALLRVLETRKFRRVGAVKEMEVSVRVIAATNVDIAEALGRGILRSDLYYRLNAYHIHLPPLRERKEDILPLAEHFMTRLGQMRGYACEGFTPAAAERLCRYDYPGNARELRNIIERAWITCRNRGEHGPVDAGYINYLPLAKAPIDLPQGNGEQAEIREALQACRWNRRQAARELGMPYSTLRYKIKHYGLEE